MAKDERLYMTFPIDFHRHPKVVRLPVEVRWTFVEMVAESRIADDDGIIPAEHAEFMWPKDHLDALVGSHPTRPLVVRDGDFYVLREYAKHQQTRAEREALATKRAEAGRKGGLAKSQASASSGLADGGKPKHSQSQSQSHKTSTYVTESQSLDNRARETTDELSAVQKSMAARAGLDVERISGKVRDQLGIDLSLVNALALGNHILSKRATSPDKPTGYVLSSITRNPAEIAKHLYDAGLT
ncbi:hypothetical protein FVO59_11845 [Microbacterium esteraromaticum]|uniref:Uncharacterized protein n=1 Tax=Microbacterium esteraromaticum TaxID=57043 RepID=A0A7D8ACP4_9MICO|nr:hypothetical protein [Microbacterium esteraromaticum]QMU97821.1 hypothetical protein FVO59_11845 [Microbacterium esteraromaticum]